MGRPAVLQRAGGGPPNNTAAHSQRDAPRLITRVKYERPCPVIDQYNRNSDGNPLRCVTLVVVRLNTTREKTNPLRRVFDFLKPNIYSGN